MNVRPMPWHNKPGRLRDVWLILTGNWSLHGAWQAGFDDGHRLEYHRLITNKAAYAELRLKPDTGE